ncbi:MAG: hypothetical protein ACYCPW_09425 [Nitrososphaerales archaeon]
MAARTKIMIDKQVVIRGDLHSKIRRHCFENDLQMKDLINLMLTSILEDAEKLQEIISELQAEAN